MKSTRTKRLALTKRLLRVQNKIFTAVNVTEQKRAIEEKSHIKQALRELREAGLLG